MANSRVVRLSLLYASIFLFSACGKGHPDPLDSPVNHSALPWHTFEASGPVRFSASVTWDETADEPLLAFLSFHNPTDTDLGYSTGICGFGLRAYTVAPPHGEPVWDDRPPTLGPNQAYGCPDMEIVFNIGPGETEIVPIHNLGLREFASLPRRGRYVFAIIVEDGEGVVYVVPSDTVFVH